MKRPKYINSKYLIILLFFFLTFFVFNAFSYSIYIKPTGNDSNPGTPEKPLATLQAARDLARIVRKDKNITEPIEIIISAGNYLLKDPLELTAEDSGTDKSPLIFKGAHGAIPVFSGGIKLPAFEKVSERLWKISIPQIALYEGSIQQLFINGKRAIRARTPNGNHLYKTKKASELAIDTNKSANITVTTKKIYLTSEQLKSLSSLNDDELQRVILSVHHAWDRTRKYIQARSIEDSAIYIIGKKMHPFNKLDNSSQLFFENSRDFLDSPGEWFLDPSGDLFYIPREGEQIKNSTAIIPAIEKFIVIKGKESQKVQYIQFENLSFQFTKYIMPMAGNENDQAASFSEASIMIDYAKNIEFKNIEISHTANNGIWFRSGCSDSKLTNSYLNDLGIGGVKIGGLDIPKNKTLVTKNILIDNNIIRSGGHEFPTGVGLTIFHASDNIVSHNDISDFIYSGVSVGWVWGYTESPAKRNKIVFNHIHHLGWGLLSDMGGVYTLGESEGTVVSNNVIHDIYSYGYGGWGLYTDEGSTGVVMENNLVYNCKSAGFHQHYGKDNIIRNNIFAFMLNAQLEATRVEKHQGFSFTNNIIYFNGDNLTGKAWDKANFLASNNIYWNTKNIDLQFGKESFREWQQAGKDKGSIIADPNFVNPLQYDFHFKNKSTVSKIKFKPFDYTQAGVYGNEAWRKLALLDEKVAKQFEKEVNERILEDGD